MKFDWTHFNDASGISICLCGKRINLQPELLFCILLYSCKVACLWDMSYLCFYHLNIYSYSTVIDFANVTFKCLITWTRYKSVKGFEYILEEETNRQGSCSMHPALLPDTHSTSSIAHSWQFYRIASALPPPNHLFKNSKSVLAFSFFKHFGELNIKKWRCPAMCTFYF